MNKSIAKGAARAKTVLALGVLTAALFVVGLAAPPAHASTTFTVNSAADLADVNVGDNATTGDDTIKFNIPGTGVKTISPNTNLPNIIDTLSIEGFSQPGAVPNTLEKGTNAKLMIELNGSGVTGTSDSTGLRLSAPNSRVQGLVINRFNAGVAIFADSASLLQNFIGTDPSGTEDRGNSILGVFDQGFGASIGSPFSREANLISGNDGAGIAIRDLASHTQVSHNLIGTDKSGTKNLGNSKEGVEISNSSNNFLESNTIAFNGGDGVHIKGGGPQSGIIVSANTISSNSMFANGGLGINLVNPNAEIPVGGSEGSTANDVGDADVGPNGLQNFPVISSAKTVSRKTTIKGKLNSAPNESYTLQFFSNPKGENEGKKFIGQKSVATDASGNASFSFRPKKGVKPGQNITATTATRELTLDTSEFSGPRKVSAS
jgi:parallel beta-helix repeat protein